MLMTCHWKQQRQQRVHLWNGRNHNEEYVNKDDSRIETRRCLQLMVYVIDKALEKSHFCNLEEEHLSIDSFCLWGAVNNV